MSIVIINVSPDDAPDIGANQYEVRINGRVICQFEHDRAPDGLAACLRDAADAVDAKRSLRLEQFVSGLQELVRQHDARHRAQNICFDCGNKYGNRRPSQGVGAWGAVCDWCHEEKLCTAPRDFGYPDYP